MRYNPKQYWQKRKEPNSQLEVPQQVEEYFNKHLQGSTILDFGVGTGRLLYLYEGYKITGLDFVDTYREQCIKEAERLGLEFRHVIGQIESVGQPHDTVIVSKVLLHVLPEDLQWTLYHLKQFGDKIIVWDAIDQDAPHVFDHDFSKYGEMKDVEQWDNELLFYY